MISFASGCLVATTTPIVIGIIGILIVGVMFGKHLERNK